MGGFARVNGVSYDVSGGFTKISGVNYDISGGRTLVDGVQRDISFGAAIDPVFANNDWATIIYASQSRQVPDTWAVADQKAMTINGTSYMIDIIGKNHDTYSDGSGTAPLTFQMHDCYAEKKKVNNSETNSGGWRDCVMRNTHLPAILALMPNEVQTGIREVNKLASKGEGGEAITTADKLFLLSEIEIFGRTQYSVSGEGSQYEYYSGGNSKVKRVSGVDSIWWERSPYKTKGTKYFCRVYSTGVINSGAPQYEHGVAFAFCF